MHIAASMVDILPDYVLNTPQNGLHSAASVSERNKLIEKNLKILKKHR